MITISKTLTAPNAAVVNHHVVTELRIAPRGDAITIIGGSWVNSQTQEAGIPPVARWAQRIEITDLNIDLCALLAAQLVVSGPLEGGTVLVP